MVSYNYLKVDGQDDTDTDNHDDKGESNEMPLEPEVLDGVAATLLQELVVAESEDGDENQSGDDSESSQDETENLTMKHSCQYCNKGFPTASKLGRHERIHTGEKPFNCSLCDEWFTYKYQLTKHATSCSSEKNIQT